jgi:hypothetical protein
MFTYYINQNNKSVIGGKISKAKSFWLGYAMFHYFILPWWILFYITEDSGMECCLYIILGIFYFRMLFQMLLMFVTRTWSPPIGMAYNIMASLVLLYLLFNRLFIENFAINNCILIVYICILILILLTDTYYARSFYHLVGLETKGKNAIWFASDEEKFIRINRITARNNVIFISLSLILLLLFLLKYAVH